VVGILGCNGNFPSGGAPSSRTSNAVISDTKTAGNASADFAGAKAGDEREVAGIKLCWCPPGRFRMGSPPDEPERRPDETQVDVILTQGFWMGKYEVTQGQWKRIVGNLPGPLTAELPAGEDFPVGNVNYAEAETFCRTATELARQSGDLPAGWEFRLPTEAQWEYAVPGRDQNRHCLWRQT
jgi:formylglycine-generating enzyme required for sulfatase activity